jgi:hypothetical protein
MPEKKILLSIMFLISTLPIFTQTSSKEDVELRKNAISFNILGPTPFVGITYERVITKNFIAEAGLGWVSFGLGVKVYPSQIKTAKIKFYLGVSGMGFNFNAAQGNFYYFGAEEYYVYIPIGFSYFSKRGFNFGFDLGPAAYYDVSAYDPWSYGALGNLRFGYRF